MADSTGRGQWQVAATDVLIVGGGLAGLCCARHLREAGISVKIFEASDQPGGRARTDELDGFLLDRGFQVLLTSYPEARRMLDLEALELARFEPGALVRWDGRFHRFTDIWRRPTELLATALSPVASLGDKWRIAQLRRQVCRASLEEIYARPERTTLEVLRERGFSDRVIERFFRPFLGGVFLDRELQTSSRMFEFVFRMFSQGDAALPSGGMGQIARQLAAGLPPDCLHLNSPVVSLDAGSIGLASGERLTADAVVLACDAPAASRLLAASTVPPSAPPPTAVTVEEAVPAGGPPAGPFGAGSSSRAVTCLYYAAPQPPLRERLLVLNGEGCGPINNLCVPTEIAPSYGPGDRSLVSVTVLGLAADADQLRREVGQQLRDWFGSVVDEWSHLRTYTIAEALPSQVPPALSPVAKPSRRDDGIFMCGDFLNTASLHGAMRSGRLAAEAIIRERTAAVA